MTSLAAGAPRARYVSTARSRLKPAGGSRRGGTDCRLVVGHGLPGAVEVVALHGGEVEGVEDLAGLEAGVDLRRGGRQERGELVVLAGLRAVRVELACGTPPAAAVKFGLVLGPDDVAGVALAEPGHSQSRSMPSKTPAPSRPAGVAGQRQVALDEQVDAGLTRASAATAAVSAASEKYFDSVQPPSEISTLRFGCLALSCLSWLKLPASGWRQCRPTPSTLSSAPNGRW